MAPKRTNEGPRVVGLSDLGREDSHADDSSDDHVTYYAGGEKSGVAVEGGDSRDAAPSGVEAARRLVEHAARVQRPPETYSGRGRRLADDEPGDAESLPLVERTMTLWADGFTVDGGALQPWAEPGNREVLDALQRGIAPRHLLNVAPGQPVDLRIEQRLSETYVPPPATHLPFTGASHRLGDIASVPAPQPAAAAQPAQGPAALHGAGATSPSVQLRLPGGRRDVVRVLPTHTLGELRAHVSSIVDGAFRMLAGRPPRVLDSAADGDALAALGLVNSAIIVETE